MAQLGRGAPPTVNWDAREQYPGVYRVRAKPGKAPLELAREYSEAHGMLPIWAQDLPNPTNDPERRGNKCFDVGSYSAFKDQYRDTPPENRCVYEVERPGLPTRAHIDIDGDLTLNPDLTADVLRKMVSVVIEETGAVINEIVVAAGGVAEPRVPTVIDSSKPVKVSKHIVFDVFFQNNFHCGALMRTVRNRIVCKYEKAAGVGDRDQDHPYYLWTRVKDRRRPGENATVLLRECFVDLSIYTALRNFRIYGSMKRIEGALPLIAQGEVGFSWDTYDRCLLQRWSPGTPIYACLEVDGSEPQSTSKTHLHRTDGVTAPSWAAHPKPAKQQQQQQPQPQPRRFAPTPHLLPHWSQVFPFDLIFNVLAPASGAQSREFRFTDVNNTWTPARYFGSAAEFHAGVLKEQPAAVHIGPICVPDSATAVPEQPTLVFDIDIRDYAAFRPCCGSTGAACSTCWPIAGFAQRAVAAFAATCDLGTPVAFFSGSKGVHIWILGGRAAEVAGESARRNLVDLFNLPIPAAARNGALTTTTTTGSASAASAGFAIPQCQAVTRLSFVQSALGDEASRAALTAFICGPMGLRDKFHKHSAVFGSDSAILHVLWPQIDDAVTVKATHKIKAPFCIHPRTSRVCVWLQNPNVDPYAETIDPVQNARDLAEFCSHVLL